MNSPVVVTCAITGAMTVPSQSPYIPITPEQIAESAIEAHRAGAAVVHIHVREEDGRPSARPELFKEVHSEVTSACDVIFQPTTGGGVGVPIEERSAVVPLLQPEMASLNMGSFNFGIFRIAERVKEWKYEWERDYLEGTKDYVFRNTFKDLEYMCRLMRDNGTKPELEVYDVGHLYNVAYLLERELLDQPVQIQFVLGVLGGNAARLEELMHLRQRAQMLIGDHTWSAAGVGYRGEYSLGTLSMLLGGSIRVGLEDNLRVSPDALATSNAELVEKAVRIAGELDREPASSDEARRILGIRR